MPYGATLHAGARQPSSGAFDPIAGVGWTNAYWTEGDEFVALGLADGAAVDSWPDDKGTLNLAKETTSPTYRATGGPSSTPAVETFGAAGPELISGASSISQPLSIVLVCQADTATNKNIIDGRSTSSNRCAVYGDGSGKWGLYAGSGQASTTSVDTAWHLIVGYFNGASSVLELDGTSILSGVSPGTDAMDGVSLFGYAGIGGDWDGNLVFAARSSGDVRSDGGWTDFENWVEDHYGLTIA